MLTRDGHTDLQALTERDALALLRSQTVGRLAVLDGGHPLVLPVAFGLVDDVPVFRTGGGAKLRAARGSPASFEVDEIHPMTWAGWSVVVRGRARAVREPAQLARLRALALEYWSVGDKPDYVEITPTLVSGRRVHQGGEAR